jgi:hypothetical protein
VGTDSQYVVDTFGRPRHISIDPDNWVLKSTPDLQVRVAILKGQQLVAQGDLTGALAEYQKALEANPQSSLATTASAKCCLPSATTRPAPTPIATRCAATASRAGPRSGATSRWARSSTLPASATAPSTSTAWRCRPTTTPRARSTRPANGLKQSGQYDLVADPAEADLVLELQLTAPNGPASDNKVKGASEPLPMFRLVVYDRKTHFVLWAFTQSIELAYLQKTHDRNFDDALNAILLEFEGLSGKAVAH